MDDSVKRICLNCVSCGSYAKGKYICDTQNYREILPFNEACELYIATTPQERKARKEFEEKYPGVFKDGEINLDSPDFDKMIDRISEIANEGVYKWRESDISYMEKVDDSILTTITEKAQITILDNAIDFKETVKLLSEFYLAVRRIGLLRLEDIINDNNTKPIVMRDFITNMVVRIVDGTDPDEIARWCLEEYDNIQEQDEYKKLALSFSYQALRKLQGGESIKALKVLCWKYVPTNIRSEIDEVIEKVKEKYE